MAQDKDPNRETDAGANVNHSTAETNEYRRRGRRGGETVTAFSGRYVDAKSWQDSAVLRCSVQRTRHPWKLMKSSVLPLANRYAHKELVDIKDLSDLSDLSDDESD